MQLSQIVVVATLVWGLISAGQSNANAETADLNTIKVCQRLAKIQKPRGISPDGCYEQAKDFLKSKNIKVMLGSYQAYFALSDKEDSQKVCRPFLRSVVDSTLVMDLNDAKEIFGNDRAQSLDRSYFSYQACQDREKKLAQSSNSSSNAPGSTSTGAR